MANNYHPDPELESNVRQKIVPATRREREGIIETDDIVGSFNYTIINKPANTNPAFEALENAFGWGGWRRRQGIIVIERALDIPPLQAARKLDELLRQGIVVKYDVLQASEQY